jgi:hypothetical protein
MRRTGEDPIPRVVWVVIAGAFILVIASAESAALAAAQVGVMLVLLGIYLVVRRRRMGG